MRRTKAKIWIYNDCTGKTISRNVVIENKFDEDGNEYSEALTLDGIVCHCRELEDGSMQWHIADKEGV